MKSILYLVSILFLINQIQTDKTSVNSREDAFQWLDKYGYNPCGGADVQCASDLGSLLKEYQRRFHLAVTGILDDATKTQMNKPRCGNQDKPKAKSNAPLALSAYKWKRSSLKYSIRSYPTEISESMTRSIIQEAFKAWTDYIPLQIEETCSSCQADFVLEFASGTHTDTFPFDGVGGTLAHAFFPEDGRVHFDKDEPWTERFDDTKINLFLVAVHEIGHAIGLDHTYDDESIMFPSYQLMSKNKILPQPDRESIQSMYGKKQSGGYNTPSYGTKRTTQTTSTTTTTTTRRPIITARYHTQAPSGNSNPRCRLFLDAAFKHPDGTLHTFVEKIVRRYLPNERQWEQSSTSYEESYPNLPRVLGAAVYHPENNQILFFTPRYIYVYNIDHSNRATIRYNTPIPKKFRKPILGAFYYKNSIHVISTSTIATFDISSRGRISNERSLRSEFPGYYGTLKTAFSYGHLHHLFTDENLVFVWNELTNNWDTLGQPMENNWFACTNNPSFLVEQDTKHRPTLPSPPPPRSRHQNRHRPY